MVQRQQVVGQLLDLAASRDANLKLVLDYSFGTASFVMPNLLSKLEADVLVVNPYANTAGATTFDRRASAARVAGPGATVRVVRDPPWVTVTVRRAVAGSWLARAGLAAEASATAWVEP